MKFANPQSETQELSLDDVFIFPQYFHDNSRHQVNLSPYDFPGSSNPLVSANMNAVTGKRMAETMARLGGLGILPQDMSFQTIERIVNFIKDSDTKFDTPLYVYPNVHVRDVQGLIHKRSQDLVVVLNTQHVPVGVINSANLENVDQYTPILNVMEKNFTCIEENATYQDAYNILHQYKINAAPVVNQNGILCGVISKNDAVRFSLMSPSITNNHLMVGVAVGIGVKNLAETIENLIYLNVNAVVLDTAHGHQYKMIEAIKIARKQVTKYKSDMQIIAGNVCTPRAVKDLVEAGADIIKVNVGPGAMCTTRMQTGVGRPTFSAVYQCAKTAKALGKNVWADGGVKHPRDVALYLAAGASRVMVGSIFAGTYESPGDLKRDNEGFFYKENYGMASARAVSLRNDDTDPFEKAKRSIFQEGVSSSRVYLQKDKPSVGDIVMDIVSGVKSSCTYTGSLNISSFQENAVIGVQTNSGYKEGLPHLKLNR